MRIETLIKVMKSIGVVWLKAWLFAVPMVYGISHLMFSIIYYYEGYVSIGTNYIGKGIFFVMLSFGLQAAIGEIEKWKR